MARIIFELDAIEDIKNKLDSLIQKGQKIDSTDFKKLVKQRTGFLDENEKMVFRCIEEKEGQSHQNIVDVLKELPPEKSLSRKPVFNAIKSLIKRGMVVSEPDGTNSRIHRLYVNRGNLIIQVENEIKDFKRSYLKLIKRADEEYGKKLDLTEYQLKKSKRPDLDIPELYSAGVANGLTDIFRQLIITYSLNAVFKWSREIKDLDSLNRLYLTVFQNLNEIYSQLVKYVPFDIQDEHKRIEYLQESLKYTFEDAKMYVKMIPEFDEYNIGSEFDSVMSNLFTALKMRTTWKDYRTGLNEYESEYPS
jgi:hypothetical protein